MIIIYGITSVLFFTTLFFSLKYFKLKNAIKEYDSIGTGRHGFYNYNNGSYRAIVYVIEIDRYKDGYSKIKYDHAEPTGSFKDNSIKYAKDNFITLVQTKNIEWLESEDDIKKMRKEKLEKIKKL